MMKAKKKDGLLRHPADSPLWKDFDEKHKEFAKDSRNIRLAFATDGFNPFRTMNVSYSMWPGICIPYNFPPSMCMKSKLCRNIKSFQYGSMNQMDLLLITTTASPSLRLLLVGFFLDGSLPKMY